MFCLSNNNLIDYPLMKGVFSLTEKELKKLNRYHLLELLILQTERADKLQARLDETENQLNNLNIQISSLGSIAEASLQLRGVFDAAQDAADMYIDAAKKQAEEILEAARKQSAEMIAKAAEEVRSIKGD